MTIPPTILHGKVLHIWHARDSFDRRRRVEICVDLLDGTFAHFEVLHDRLMLNEPVTITIAADNPEYGSEVLKTITGEQT